MTHLSLAQPWLRTVGTSPLVLFGLRQLGGRDRRAATDGRSEGTLVSLALTST